jgi:hypothetical protein
MPVPPFASASNLNYEHTLLNDFTNKLLEGIAADNATLVKQADQQQEAKRAQQAQEAAIEHQEEQDFQIALAASLGRLLPVAGAPEPLSGSTTNPPATRLVLPSTIPSHVHTVPYHSPTITQHMSTEWMRPMVDNTKKPRKAYQNNPDHRFFLVFWGKVCFQILLIYLHSSQLYRLIISPM